MDYAGKVILLTGASSGIGRATALALSHFGTSLVITARRAELLEAVAAEVRANGSSCLVFAGDALDPAHADKVVAETVKAYGRIDIAIFNIGIGPTSNTLTASREKILHCMRSDYDTMINFYYPVMQQMKRQTTRCMIVQMNSQASYFGVPTQGDYTAAKSAGRIFLDTVRMELRHFGYKHIVIQTVHPGFVATDAVKGDANPTPDQISEEEAARHVLRGLRKEMRENLFPFKMKCATRFGRIVPNRLLTRILLSATPADY